MSLANTVDPSEGVPWYKLFEALSYVTNPYALLAYLFLVVIVAIGFSRISERARGLILFVLAVLVIGAVWGLLGKSLEKVADRSSVHLVNEAGRSQAEILPGVSISLLDVTSLEGKAEEDEVDTGVAANRSLPAHILSDVFERADIRAFDAAQIRAMNQNEWDAYLDTLGEKRRKVLDTSFAKLRIEVKGQPVREDWWLKNVPIKLELGDGKVAMIALTNIYNTKNDSSGEREAVNLKVTDP